MRVASPAAILAVTILLLSVPASAEEPTKAPPADRFLLSKVRLLPKPGAASTLTGARITGSNEGPTNGFVELARIESAIDADAWLDVPVKTAKVYRWIKFESAKGQAVALAEVEFYSPAGRLKGAGFGTASRAPSGSSGTRPTTFDMALDGDPATFFEAPTESSYVGIDLGQAAQAPRPHFKPEAGACADPQKIEIAVWPPGATIRYTTDGSAPTATTGEVYKAPVPVAATTTFAAVACQEGLADSDLALATYLIGAAVAASPPLKSYHIGNSLTDTVDGFLGPIAQSAGKNFIYIRKTIPGCGLMGNWKSCGQGFASPWPWANDYNVVFDKKIDHLFLQVFPNPPGLKDDTEAGNDFIAAARKGNPDVQSWLYAQWPERASWKNDAHCVGAGWMQPPWFPKNRTPATWEEATANKMEYYTAVLNAWNEVKGPKPVRLCPGGPALVRLKKEMEEGHVPGLTDFRGQIFADDIHLARPGRYLVALVHYACIYAATPEGHVTFANSGCTKDGAAVLQRIAWETVTAEPLSGVKP